MLELKSTLILDIRALFILSPRHMGYLKTAYSLTHWSLSLAKCLGFVFISLSITR